MRHGGCRDNRWCGHRHGMGMYKGVCEAPRTQDLAQMWTRVHSHRGTTHMIHSVDESVDEGEGPEQRLRRLGSHGWTVWERKGLDEGVCKGEGSGVDVGEGMQPWMDGVGDTHGMDEGSRPGMMNRSAFVCTRDAGIVVGVNMGQYMHS